MKEVDSTRQPSHAWGQVKTGLASWFTAGGGSPTKRWLHAILLLPAALVLACAPERDESSVAAAQEVTPQNWSARGEPTFSADCASRPVLRPSDAGLGIIAGGFPHPLSLAVCRKSRTKLQCDTP